MATAPTPQWIDRIGRRVKLRDLRILLAVAQSGSMSRAAERMAVSHPVVSKTIGDLEHALGVRLFDRTARGVEATQFGLALLDCGAAVFDDLRRGMQKIEFLSDPSAGELRIGAVTPFMDGLVMAVVESFVGRYPRIRFHLTDGDGPALHRALHDRKIDLAVARLFRPIAEEEIVCDTLFEEQLFVVGGLHSRWTRRRKIEFRELLGERWVMPEYDGPVGSLITDGFRSIGMMPLKPQIVSNSIAIRLRLVAGSGFLTMLPGSMLRFVATRLPVKALRVALPMRSQPIEIVTLKNRTLSPVALLFIKHLHEAARPLATRAR
jgi:DNA-binding transcriptional LysR family regulator